MADSARLWQKIGIDPPPLPERPSQSQSVSASRGKQSIEEYISMRKTDSNNMQSEEAEVEEVLQSYDYSSPQVATKKEMVTSMERTMGERQRQVLVVEESLIEQIEQPFPRQFQGSNGTHHSVAEAELSAYNYELSDMPASITPLVYSKNSRRDDVRFSKSNAKMVLVRLKLTESRSDLVGLRREVVKFMRTVEEEHDNLRRAMCEQHYQLQRQHSLRLQESMFLHKQEYQQLKYELEVLKAKEDTLKTPVKSELVVQSQQEFTGEQEWKKEREKLQSLLRSGEEVRQRQAQEFQQKVLEIEADAAEVRESNHKLYECIFDLEQKVTFHKEEGLKMEGKMRERIRGEYEREVEQQILRKDEEIEELSNQINELERESCHLRLQNQVSEQKLSTLETMETQIQRMTQKIGQLQEQKSVNRHAADMAQQQLAQRVEEVRQLRVDLERVTRQNEQLSRSQSQWRNSNFRFSDESKGYSQTDPKAFEALQIEKIVLQKENTQLKATIEYMNRTQSVQPSSASSLGHIREGESRERTTSQRARELEIKEKELMEYQSFVELEMKKLELKQQMDKLTPGSKKEEFTPVAKPSDYVYQPIISPRHKRASPAPGDDYCMKGTTIHSPKAHKMPVQPSKPTTNRSNHFCQPQTQAIIDKVRMRQQIRDYDERSRTSRESEESRSIRGHHYRPSPVARVDYMLSHQKNAKMRIIEDKVRRLKSQLKTSLTSTQ